MDQMPSAGIYTSCNKKWADTTKTAATPKINFFRKKYVILRQFPLSPSSLFTFSQYFFVGVFSLSLGLPPHKPAAVSFFPIVFE